MDVGIVCYEKFDMSNKKKKKRRALAVLKTGWGSSEVAHRPELWNQVAVAPALVLV